MREWWILGECVIFLGGYLIVYVAIFVDKLCQDFISLFIHS